MEAKTSRGSRVGAQGDIKNILLSGWDFSRQPGILYCIRILQQGARSLEQLGYRGKLDKAWWLVV